MNHHYKDITDRIPEPPLWYDEYAVPRYCEFGPRESANIYARQVALVEIACQDCNTRFKVAFSSGPLGPPLSAAVNDGTLHYGDPPNSGCCGAGPTMNSVPIRVLEFWDLSNVWGDGVRVSELEKPIPPDWTDERESAFSSHEGGPDA